MNKEQNLFKFKVGTACIWVVPTSLIFNRKKAIAQTEQGMVQNESFPVFN